jgi:hypothetical protein
MSRNKKLKILFVIRSTNHFSYFKSIVRALFEHSHEVFCLFDKRWSKGFTLEPLKSIKRDYPNFNYDWAIRDWGRYRLILHLTRALLGYRRYLNARQTTWLIDRWVTFFPTLLQPFLRMPAVKMLVRNKWFAAPLRLIEKIIPPSPRIRAHITELNPDVLLASPVSMRFLSTEGDYLKAAIKMNIPTALPVYSWDHLTTNGFIHSNPDLLLVWNKEQLVEAKEQHEIPEEKIKLIGASLFDEWFNSNHKPSCTRREFCKKFGLAEDLPIVTYLASHGLIKPSEDGLVVAARKALDNSNIPLLQQVQLVVRPHPSIYEVFEKINMERLVFVPSKKGSLPTNTPEEFQLFYDTLYHSAAVVQGVNTSAIFNAIIMNKPSIVILTDEYKKYQEETLHFRQLLANDVLYLAHDIEQFPLILKKLLNGFDERKEKRQFFVQEFIRPRGLEVSAGEAAVLEIEKLASERGK